MRLGTCSKCHKPTYVETPCCDEPVLYNGSFSAYMVSKGAKWEFPTRRALVPVPPPLPVVKGKPVLRLVIGGKK